MGVLYPWKLFEWQLYTRDYVLLSPYSAACQESKNCFIPGLRSMELPPSLVLYNLCLCMTLGKKMSFQKHRIFIHQSSQEMLNCTLLALTFGIGFGVLQMVKCYKEGTEVIISLHNVSKIISRHISAQGQLFLLLLTWGSRTIKESYRTANRILPKVWNAITSSIIMSVFLFK